MDTEDGTNAPCCWAVQIGGEWRYLSQEDGGSGDGVCRWSTVDCDCASGEGEIALEIYESHMVLTICGEEFSEGLAEAPNCCAAIVIGDYTIYPVSSLCCSFSPECIQVTISGVENTCSCSACATINGTYSLTRRGPSYYEGDLCNAAHEYDRCSAINLSRGYNYIKLGIPQGSYGCASGSVTVQISSYEIVQEELEYAGETYWTGTFNAESETFDLSYSSGGSVKCDFSASTAMVTVGPNCPPCGESVGCTENDIFECFCKDNAWPSYWEITIPGDGFIGGVGWTGSESRTFLVPAGCQSGCLYTGTHLCADSPTVIRVAQGPGFGYPLQILLQWSTLTYNYCTTLYNRVRIEFLADWPDGNSPSDYCVGDSDGSFDCFLYGLTLNCAYASYYRSGITCPSPAYWDNTKFITVKAIP
jgi:hypothetical protein